MSFDAESLMEEYDDDKEIIAHMANIFDRDCGERLPKLREAVAAGDCQSVMREAHAIKGGLGTFFADSAYEAANQLETMGRNDDAGNAAEALRHLETELTSFRQALDDLIRS